MTCWDHVAYVHWSILRALILWRPQFILQFLERTPANTLLVALRIIVATWVSSVACGPRVLDLVVLTIGISSNGALLYSAWAIYQGVPS